ncbi:MAG: acyl carrier protein [Myxococcaceae bacterium]|nr:acyl carrier protein [Myxococcaceae bacterium]
MNREALKKAVLEALAAVAPELDPDTLRPNEPLREQLDIDSFDFLQFIIGLDQNLSLSIPETDYGRLTTLDALVDYLGEKLGGRPGGK